MKLFFVWLGLLISAPVFAEINEQQAEEIVKNTTCLGDKSITEVLKKKIKKRSQRDLGWKVFKEDEYYDVERALQISKSMKIRYRWRVNRQGEIEAVGKRAQKLCSED